ncbi:MAG: hypothetical protein RLZZ301_1514 [Bacteroidota bacterium]|jgi:XTP/dITP diphosphohydrolase
MELIFATHNQHKADEIQSLLPAHIQLRTLTDLGLTEEIPENEDTIEGNSVAKAIWIYERFGLPCFADDTGLEVDALAGRPGVHSARYAGPEKDPQQNMALLLQELKGVAVRDAQFKTVITLIIDGKSTIFTGIVRGKIGTVPVGDAGFGYDPLFFPESEQRSFAQMNMAEKNKFSHRARALDSLIAHLQARD